MIRLKTIIATVIFVLLMGCDFLGGFGPMAKMPRHELIQKSSRCKGSAQSSPIDVQQCKSYADECGRRNRVTGQFVC